MLQLTQLAVAALMASTAVAVPFADHHHHQHLHEKRQGQTFNINVKNSCSSSQSFGLFQITSGFDMLSMSNPSTVAPGGTTTIAAPFNALGMRLSATADQGTAAQWNAQALFEFGYSSYGGNDGTAYNLSVMEGSIIGVAVTPANSNCESKSCSPGNCAPSQGWTSPGQDALGSPADTTCYYGPTDFTVEFCP